jgi:hypothetical protein
MIVVHIIATKSSSVGETSSSVGQQFGLNLHICGYSPFDSCPQMVGFIIKVEEHFQTKKSLATFVMSHCYL